MWNCSGNSCSEVIFEVLTMIRSNHLRCFLRKDILRNFAKFTGKHLYLLFIKLPNILKRHVWNYKKTNWNMHHIATSHCNIERWLKIDRHDWRLIDIQTSQCALRFWLWKKRLSDYGLFWKIPLPMRFAVCRAIKENDFRFLSLLLSLCLLRTQQSAPNPIKRNLL